MGYQRIQGELLKLKRIERQPLLGGLINEYKRAA